jgi:hypothetical protein
LLVRLAQPIMGQGASIAAVRTMKTAAEPGVGEFPRKEVID